MRWLTALLLAVPLWGAAGDITAVRIAKDTCTAGISCNGWVAEIDISQGGGAAPSTGGTYALELGANNDPSTAKIVFTVTSPGYDATGSVTTITRTVYGVKQLRKPYPNQTTMDEAAAAGTLTVRVAVSDFIYVSDTVTVAIASGFYAEGGTSSAALAGGTSVTNNSTATYPKVIGHFALEQRRPVNATTAVEVFAVHRFAQNGKPVAAVVITATGATSSHSETATVAAMTLSARGDKIPVYAASLNLSVAAGFTRGELVNINFTAYPWVGDATSVLDATTDAGASTWQLGPLKWTIMDKMIAVVDPGAGIDATCVASATQATADAAPCLTITGALTAIAAANNSAYSLNRTDGGEVQLLAGTYKHGKYSTQAVTNGYFTIKPHSSTNRAGVVFDGYVTSRNQYAYQRYYNVTFQRPDNTVLVYASAGNVLVMEAVNLADSGTGWYSGTGSTTMSDIEVLDSITGNSYFTKGGNDGHSRLNRNNTYTDPTGAQFITGNAACVLGLKVSGTSTQIWTAITGIDDTNVVIAYSAILAKTDGYFIKPSTGKVTNCAIVNNLVERIGASATPLGDMSDSNHSNILVWHNSFSGQRFNAENDTSSAYVNKTFLNWMGKYGIFSARGDHRADISDSTTEMTGTWSVGYSVGWDGNHNEAISYVGDTDFWGLRSNIDTGTDSGTSIAPPAPVGYIADYSRDGTDAGNGDYHLATGSAALNKVPSGSAVLPYDLDGVARRNDGTGAAGAYEYPLAATGVRHRVSQ